MKSITRHLTFELPERMAWPAAVMLVALSLGGIVVGDDRPTPEAVARAVQESRAKFVQTQRPAEYLKIVQGRLDDAKKRRIEANQEPQLARRKKLIETSRDEIATLEAELKQVKAKKGRPGLLGSHASGLPVLVRQSVLEREQPLMPLDWSRLAIGQVGEVGICSYGNHAGEAIRCQRKLDQGAFLGCHSVHDGFGYNRVIESPSVVITGVDKADDGSDLQVGECCSMTFTAIVTGTTQIDIPGVGSKTVFVVEKFDPDKPFN